MLGMPRNKYITTLYLSDNDKCYYISKKYRQGDRFGLGQDIGLFNSFTEPKCEWIERKLYSKLQKAHHVDMQPCLCFGRYEMTSGEALSELRIDFETAGALLTLHDDVRYC